MAVILTSNSLGFDSTDITVNNSGTYVDVLHLVVPIRFQGRPLFVQGDVGAGGALNGFKVQMSFLRTTAGSNTNDGGVLKDIYVDAAINTPDDIFLLYSSGGVHTAAAGATFQLVFLHAPFEIKFLAKKNTTDTTLRLRGRSHALNYDD